MATEFPVKFLYLFTNKVSILIQYIFEDNLVILVKGADW